MKGVFLTVSLACGLLLSCAGSDGHPPALDEDTPQGGQPGGDDTGQGGDDTGSTPKPGDGDGSLLHGGHVTLPAVVDIAYDGQRGVLYASTADGGLASIELETGKISTDSIGTTPLMGLDLSPNGNLLAICDHTINAKGEFPVHLVDLQARSLTDIVFTKFTATSLQDGSFSAVFMSDERLLTTSSFTASGYVPLVDIEIGTGDLLSIKDVNSSTMIQRSYDNNVIAWAEALLTEGPFGFVNAKSSDPKHDLRVGTLGNVLHDLAVNVDGSHLALPTRGAVVVQALDSMGKLVPIGTHVEDGRDATAAAFSPVTKSLFVTWTKSNNDGAPAFLEAYDADTLESKGVLSNNIPLAIAPRKGGFPGTRMRFSNDGSLLFVTVDKGINVYEIDAN